MISNLFAKTNSPPNQQGFMLVSVMIITGVLVAIGFSILSFGISQYNFARGNVFSANAYLVSEAGAEQSLLQLNQDESFTGFSEPVELFNNPEQGRGVFTSTIEEADDSNTRYITVTGQVYRANNTEEPESKRIIKVTVVGTGSEGYSVHSGPGGLILSGSANITNSNVFVNGTITLNGAAKIGTPEQPLLVNVAHNACPPGNNPGPTYPTTCSSGQPISMAQSTNIYGTVCATNQTSTGPNNNIQPGVSGEGLLIGCVADPVSPPYYEKAPLVDAIETTANGNDGAYVCGPWPFERNWPANLRLNGNVNVGGSCDITINGNVYITGNLSLGGASRITVADNVGDERPVVFVDGTINVGGSAQLIANDVGTGVTFISNQANASCNPNCTNLSGNELRNSQNVQTVTIGGGVNLPGMVFQAQWGRARIAGSGSVGAVSGQTVDMSGAGTVVFGTELSSGERTWSITSYQQKFSD